MQAHQIGINNNCHNITSLNIQFKQFHKYLINFLTAIHIYIICLVVCFYLINVKTAERKTHTFVATHSHMALRGDGWPVRMIKLWLEEMSNFELDQ